MEGIAAFLILGSTFGGMGLSDAPIFEKDQGFLGSDKAQHFAAGLGVASLTRVLANEYTDWSPREVFIAGCVASTTVGIAKEFYDRDVRGTRFEVADVFATAGGCLFTFKRPIGINARR